MPAPAFAHCNHHHHHDCVFAAAFYQCPPRRIFSYTAQAQQPGTRTNTVGVIMPPGQPVDSNPGNDMSNATVVIQYTCGYYVNATVPPAGCSAGTAFVGPANKTFSIPSQFQATCCVRACHKDWGGGGLRPGGGGCYVRAAWNWLASALTTTLATTCTLTSAAVALLA